MNGKNRVQVTGRKTAAPPWLSQQLCGQDGALEFHDGQRSGLAPVALHPVVAATLMSPVAVDPNRVGPGRLDPVARDPDIMGAIPPVIAANPNPAFVRTRTRMLDYNGRRTHPNVNVLRESRRDHGETDERGCCNKEQFLHGRGIPFSTKFASVAAR
jgi:hypothetical protein